MNLFETVTARHDKLAAVGRIVSRMIESGGPVYVKLTPRRMLAGLYVFYRNALLRCNRLERNLRDQTLRIEKLVARVKELENYEKQVKFAGYVAEIVCFRWTCGDGCCSDSWHGYRVVNNHGIVCHEWGMDGENTYATYDQVEKEIRENYGNAIPIHKDTREV